MDLDPVGADLSGESQLDLSPASGLDPSRQVKYVQTAATAIYPNVTQAITTPLSTVATLEPRTPAPLQVVPVVREPRVQVEGQPQQPTRLAQSAQQVPLAPSVAGPAPAAVPGQLAPTPGGGQGILGTNRLMLPDYNPNANPLNVARDNLNAQADQLEAKARSPFQQFFFDSEAKDAANQAVEKRLKAQQLDQMLQAQKDMQLKADAAGIPRNQQTATQTNDTIVENLLAKYRGGDMNARDALIARGHTDLVKAYEPEMVTAKQSELDKGMEVKNLLDSAATDAQYNAIRRDLSDPKHPLGNIGFDIPKLRGEWQMQRNKRDEQGRRAQVLIDTYKQKSANENDYTLEPKKELAEIYKQKGTYYSGETMAGTTGQAHLGNGSTGAAGPTGSHDLRMYGKKGEGGWGTYGKAQIEDTNKEIDAAYPKAEREKNISIARTIKLATTDKNGKPMDDEATKNKINTNPNIQQAVAEGLAAALRGGAGGANGQLIRIELAKRGVVQGAFDDAMAAWAGLKGAVTGKEGKYLTDLTQSQIRYVLDFIKNYTDKDVADRLSGAAERVGMMGGRLEQTGLEPELQDALKGAHAYGRDRQIQHMGEQWRVIRDNDSVFLGGGSAAAAVPGAVRTRMPATALPGMYPELTATVPAPAPGVSLPQPPGGGGPAAPVPPTVSPTGGPGGPAAPAQRIAYPGGPAPIPPTVPTPAAPGGPGTGSKAPAPAPAPAGARPGGTFSDGVPSGGFPVPINNNLVARTVYGVAGQTAQNVSSNPVIANNSAIVTTSAAQSESSFNPNETHDGGRGHGLFGHNGDRLERMQQFAGVPVTGKPGAAIPANVQTSFFVREMSKAADSDPFIARVLSDPNATAEDLTRVQIRMERPQGYKGPGTEERASNWTMRLANTKALMAGEGAAAQPAVAAAAQPAVAVQPQPSTGQLLNPRTALQSIQQKATQVGAPAAIQALPNYAPAVGGAVGMAAAGPPGALAGGAVGGAVRNYFTGGEENQTPAGYLKEGVYGTGEAAIAAVPGLGPLATAARIGLGSGVQAAKAWWEDGNITEAALEGAAGAALGEGFGQVLGMTGNLLWRGYNRATQAELIGIGRTLAKEEPKIADATGKMVENASYTKAVERAKQLGQDPDHLAHAWETVQGNIARGTTPPTRGEALTQRPGQVEAARIGREQYDPIREEVGGAQLGTPKTGAGVKYDPTKIVGTAAVPEKFKDDAVTALNTMNQKAGSWREIWNNQIDARANLLTKEREALNAPPSPGNAEAAKAYRALADQVRKQQTEIAQKLLPKDQADALIQRLERADNLYHRAKAAGGPDIVKTISAGGEKGREARAAFNELVGDDPAAKQMMSSLLKLHLKGAAKEGASLGATAGSMAGAAMFLPGGHAIAGGIGLYKGYRLLQDLVTLRGAGKTVTFNDLARRYISAKAQSRLRAAGAAIGAPAAQGVMQALP